MAYSKTILLVAALASATSSSALAQQFDFSLTLSPETFRTETQTVVVEEAREDVSIIPPQLRKVQETLVVVEAHCPGERLTTSVQTIEIEPAYERFQIVPPTFERVTDRVLEKQGRSEWVANSDGSFRYQVTEPLYRTITRMRPANPKDVRRVAIPPRTAQYRVQRVTGPRILCAPQNRIPAKTQTITRTVVDRPAAVRRIAIPGKTATMQQRVRGGVQTLTIAPPPSSSAVVEPAPMVERPVEAVMPVNASTDLRYRAQVDSENCVLWKSFTDGDAELEPRRFPWPPPDPSFQTTLPVGLFEGIATLGDMNQRLSAALDRIGIPDFRRRYYPVPYGFALVTSMEKIDDQGRPTDDRWSQDIFVLDPPSITSWLSALVTARSGRFRVTAVVVTSSDVDTDGDLNNRDEATGWLNSGLSALNADRAACAFGAKHRVTVLVYEFEHVEQQQPQMITASPIDHLTASGLRSEIGQAGLPR